MTSLEGFGSGGVGQFECRSGGMAMCPRVTVNNSVVLSYRARSGHGVCCRARWLDLGARGSPAPPGGGLDPGALVLVPISDLSPATWPCPALPRPLPRTRLLPDLTADGFCHQGAAQPITKNRPGSPW